MSAVVAREPLKTASQMQGLRYELLASGIDIPHFHASEDEQRVRDRVFPLIASMSSISTHTLWVDKRRAAPALWNQARMYSLFGGAIAKYVLKTLPTADFEQVVLIFDKALPAKQENAFLAQVKPALSRLGRPYRIYFHSVKHDFNGQIADYLAWSRYVALERKEMRPLDSLPQRLRSEFNLFRNGERKYY